MAHYAFLDENNVVVDIIYGRDEDDLVDGITNWEDEYSSHRNMRCLRTSINTFGGEHSQGKEQFRMNYAEIGGTYDDDLDAFIPPQPEDRPTWVLQESTLRWGPPIPAPTDGLWYRWDELMQIWERIPGSPTSPRPDEVQDWIWDEETLEWVIDEDPLP